MNERSRTCDTIFRRNAFLFFFSFFFFFFFTSNHFHIYFLRRSPHCGTSRSLLLFLFLVCTYSIIIDYTRLRRRRIDSFSLSHSFSQTIFLRFLHLHTRYNKIHIHECHSVALFLFLLFFASSLFPFILSERN